MVLEIGLVVPGMFVGIGESASVARDEGRGGVGAFGSPLFIDHEQAETHQGADHKIGRTESPPAHAGRPHGDQFVVACQMGERIEQRQKQGHREDGGEEFRDLDPVIMQDIHETHPGILEVLRIPQPIERNPKNKETRQAVA